jgi:radical SAM superfamily enzyme YgiQ (UPF0313 family)
MSRLFFISFNLCIHPSEVYPLGMAVVANYAQRHGHTVFLYDYLASGQDEVHLETAVRDFNPDYLCVSIRNLDNDIDSSYCTDNTHKFNLIGNCIRHLKELSQAAVIIGGPAVSLEPETLLNLLGADHAIPGEGEQALCSLISDLEQSRPCEKIFGKSRNFLLGSEINGALYNHELVKWYYQQSGLIGIQTKRGCPFSCLYCTYPLIEGNAFRCRDIGQVTEEIARLKSELGCQTFFFTDSVFNDSVGHYQELTEEIIRKKLDIQWSAYFTPRGLTRQDIDLCKRAGLFAVELGTDASNSTALAGLSKNFDWHDVVSADTIITDAGIACAHYVIFGGPDETCQTVEEGIRNCRQLSRSVVFGFTGVRIYPHSGLRKRAVAEGFIGPDTPLFEPVYYFSPSVEKEDLHQRICRGWNGNRRLVFPPEKGKLISQFLKINMNIKGLIWDQMCRM